jgi:hypothetical protein
MLVSQLSTLWVYVTRVPQNLLTCIAVGVTDTVPAPSAARMATEEEEEEERLSFGEENLIEDDLDDIENQDETRNEVSPFGCSSRDLFRKARHIRLPVAVW